MLVLRMKLVILRLAIGNAQTVYLNANNNAKRTKNKNKSKKESTTQQIFGIFMRLFFHITNVGAKEMDPFKCTYYMVYEMLGCVFYHLWLLSMKINYSSTLSRTRTLLYNDIICGTQISWPNSYVWLFIFIFCCFCFCFFFRLFLISDALENSWSF